LQETRINREKIRVAYIMVLFIALLLKNLCSIKLHNYGEIEEDFFQFIDTKEDSPRRR
jgi:hypothetical protein